MHSRPAPLTFAILFAAGLVALWGGPEAFRWWWGGAANHFTRKDT